ncbi:D-alanine aminotransferase [Campylobacter devanensis]|uniref:branched-chain-amino-acid transaminase n=1 Tax=Campylobacter devanensis TaxID=3161138 RepID=A0A1X9SRG4_9BACT|nr:D-amino acid aminotransferase [Campylobacter lanienae]ARQ98798.1 D-amino acid aminotransferase [Campylobacter lanienae]SUX01863.1 D-alanine aminotransferase [Campylobacter lanienae]
MAALISMQKVFLNGEFVDKDSAKISIFDRGFIFGDGIYEVVPVINSIIVEKDGFWDRFQRSLNEISLNLPYTNDEFESILNNLIEINSLKEGGLYIQITRGVAPRDFSFVKGVKPTIMAFAFSDSVLEHPAAKSGITIISTPDIRWKRRDIKSISLLGQCYAKNQATIAGADECFMVEDGYVTEAGSSSAFIIKDGTLITKPLSNEILPGIRRNRLLNLAKQIGLQIQERKFSMDEVYNADECFISAATIILLPVIKADGKAINGGKIGEYTTKLRELYKRALKLEANIS